MLITALVFFVILSVLIFVHESGHFISAKKMGIRVEEFGFGLPPRLFGVKRGETTYSINMLPIGGFVRLTGEDEVEKTKDPKSFINKKPWQRALVLGSGVLMNFMLAIIVLSVIFTQGVAVPVDKVHIEKVALDSPAYNAGLESYDVFKSMNGIKITSTSDLINLTAASLDQEVKVVVFRSSENREFELLIIPRKIYPTGEGPMGVTISNMEVKKYPIYQAPILGTMEAIRVSYVMVTGLFGMIGNLIVRSQVPTDIAGPIGIYQVTGQAVKVGSLAVLQLLGFLSLNLAVVNSLPFPALDGGRFVFVLAEMIFGKRVLPKFERVLHSVGIVVLMALILLVSVHDVSRILSGIDIMDKLRSILH